MKKLLTLLISGILLLSCINAFALPKDELMAIGVDSEIFSEGKDEYITRAEFAHMSARLIDAEEKTAHQDAFDDVLASDKYAGDVQFLKNMGIIGGAYDNMFLPDNKITQEAAYKIVSNVMGYSFLAENLGGFPEGYNRLALETGLALNSESKDGFMTRNGAVKMISYALTAKLHNFSYTLRDGELVMIPSNKEDITLLAKMGVSAYTGYVQSADFAKGSISFIVQKNKYEANPEYLNRGEMLSLTLPDGYDVYEFEKVNVLLWVNEDDEVIFIQPVKNTEILYGFIDSVNGDTSNKGYGIKYISEITLLNDEEEYDVSGDAVLRFNGKETTSASNITGNFAKIVLSNGEVTFIESWEAEQGGIVTAVNNDEISYIKQDSGVAKLKNIDSYKIKRIFINGKVSSLENIKKDSVFDFAVYDEMIMINANETVVTDVLNSVNFSGGNITIGNSTYRMKELYHSLDGKIFTKDEDITELFSLTVKAYFAPDGYVRYITPEASDALAKTKFFGVVLGTKADTFGDGREISLYRIYPDKFEKEIFKVMKKANLNGIKWDDIAKSAKNLDGKGVFEFSVNSNGVITEINYPRLFEGYGKGVKEYTTGSFGSLGTPYVTINGKTLYFPSTKMVCIYDADGEFSLGTVDWMTSLYGQSLSKSLTLSFYRDDTDGTYPALVIVTGGVNNISYRESRFGMYAGYSRGIDENGDECYKVHVYTGQKDYKTFNLSKEKIDQYFGNTKRGLISYKDEYLYNKDKISATVTVDLSAESVDWNVVDDATSAGFHKGTIKRVDNNRLWLSNGEIYFMNGTSSTRLFFEINENMPEEKILKSIDYTDLSPGDEIFFYLGSSQTVSAIVKVV